ncbi:MAG TPA: radical SAM protein [Casimicrobiaceae bacterium]|nr:radical SAM protein [Casimicrobiaceae bacterium]
MTDSEIAAYLPDRLGGEGDALIRARKKFAAMGLDNANQQMGRRWPIGCVALEITQRCNLDCTLCYLSEISEAVKDIPIEEVFRRIDLILSHYGANTDVQITGGEPTLRRTDELRLIVRRVRSLGLRPTLMTNGIKASRALLADLAQDGLMDVVFHVDTTEQRKGYQTEVQLNALRQTYIDRAAGLGLSVMFNTTIHDGNFDEIPAVVRFFREHAASVRTASFQLQADTGRGVQRARQASITVESVARQLEQGLGTRLELGASLIGHPSCNRYGLCLVANGRAYDALDDVRFIGRLQSASAAIIFDRSRPGATVRRFLLWLLAHPVHWLASCGFIARKIWRMKGGLMRSHGQVHTLSLVIHNFMDARSLERERVDACVFKTMTAEGPLSMCLHNAKRDSFILRPIRVHRSSGDVFWDPLSGDEVAQASPPMRPNLSGRARKLLRGRAKQGV